MALLPRIARFFSNGMGRVSRNGIACLSLILLAAALSLPMAADAHAARVRRPHATGTAFRNASARRLALGRLAASNPVTIATAVAKRYWGAVPCGGQITVLSNMPLPSSLESSTDGWVTFESSLGANDLQAPAATYTRCTISLAHWQWPTRGAIENDWNMFCLTVVHEMGHLLGHPHSLIPGSVMAPVFVNESNVPQICRATRLPGEAPVAHSHTR